MEARKSLEKRLGEFLGFEDESVGDVLEHLLTIETQSDLLDYLSQLLGSSDKDVKKFVEDVGRFQKGVPIEGLAEEGKEEAVKEQQPVKQLSPKPAPAAKATNAKQNKKNQNQTNKPSNNKQKATQPKHTTRPPPPASKPVTPPPPPAAAAATVVEEEPTKVEPEKPKKKYGLPPKGKPKFICGCFGTLHKPLTNCLYCGRISCAEEGYDFCPFCGFLVEEIERDAGDTNSSKSKAWQHKERLLRYDRESAKRTVVLDDQADYYSNQNSNWLTEEEQDQAYEKDEEQRSNLHRRKKQTLNIAL